MNIPTYEQYIIKPPQQNITEGTIPDIEVVCSSDRNYTLYPNPGNYVIKLKDIYKNVTSVTLFNAHIPNSSYNINRNNLIYFRETMCEQLVAEIPEGDYKPDILVTNIENALNSVGDSKYTVTLNNLTNKVSITSDLSGGENIFSLNFLGLEREKYPNRSIGKRLGFTPNNFLYASGKANITTGSTIIIGNNKSCFLTEFNVGDTFYVRECKQLFTIINITSNDEMTINTVSPCTFINIRLCLSCHRASNKINLQPDYFIILNILELENIKSNNTPVDNAFAIIPANCQDSSYGNSYVKLFNPPLSRMDRLTITFKDLDGNVIDFQGIENILEFRITSLNNPGHY